RLVEIIRSATGRALATQAQLGDQRLIAGAVGLVQVVQKATTLRDLLEQAATRVVVLLVGLEVLGQVGDAFRQDRDLHFSRTGVARRAGVVGDDFSFTFSRNRHRRSFLALSLASRRLAVGGRWSAYRQTRRLRQGRLKTRSGSSRPA